MDEAHARELLSRARERLERALAELEEPDRADDGEQYGTDDTAAELLEAEVEEGLAAPLREELEAIERAERRLAEGTYGRSVQSGQPIPDARLQAIPWAERTLEEEEQQR